MRVTDEGDLDFVWLAVAIQREMHPVLVVEANRTFVRIALQPFEMQATPLPQVPFVFRVANEQKLVSD